MFKALRKNGLRFLAYDLGLRFAMVIIAAYGAKRLNFMITKQSFIHIVYEILKLKPFFNTNHIMAALY